MNVLWIATKPPCPPIDGGRLLQQLTLQALAERGARVTVVAPVARSSERAAAEEGVAAFATPHLVPCPAMGRLATLAAARFGALPIAVARHRRAAVRTAVARLLAGSRFTVVHVEQMHALPQAAPAAARGLPVVVRAQNVESDLWSLAAERAGLGRWRRLAAAVEARRFAAWEGGTVARTAATLALTVRDAARLEELARAFGTGASTPRVVRVPAPFPACLPAAAGPLAGSPPLVLLGSGGWVPNLDAARWFLAAAWPVVRRALPEARLHVFGHESCEADGVAGAAAGIEDLGLGRDRSVISHPPLVDSRDAFVAGSILVVPLRIASGVRMKILEAWARGVPVVASPDAAEGLENGAGRALLLAADPAEFAAAIARLAGEPRLVGELVAGGRRALVAHHHPGAVADQLLTLYGDVSSRRPVPARSVV